MEGEIMIGIALSEMDRGVIGGDVGGEVSRE